MSGALRDDAGWAHRSLWWLHTSLSKGIHRLGNHLSTRVQPAALGLAIVLVLIAMGHALRIPLGSWLLFLCRRYYADYGYQAVLIGAFLEGLLVLNLYVPGSTVVILGAVASREGILSLWIVIILASIGFLLAYTLCYCLGWYGWHPAIGHRAVSGALARTKNRMLVIGPRLICIANIHPNLGAVASTAAGVLRVPLRRFLILSGISAVAWTMFWSLIAYLLGDMAVEMFNSWLLVPVVGALIVVSVVRGRAGSAAGG